MNTSELVLIDLSSIAYPIFLMSQADHDANAASTQIVARVRALATGHAYVAIACDSGRSFRAEIEPTYKANRPERNEVLHHQIRLACEQLTRDGFPVWAQKGFEADDLIATAVAQALALPDVQVLIVSADKDLLQLVGPRVRAKSIKDGSILDAAVVAEKFKVRPDQMRDYLTLVGDASDNIKGAAGIGPAKAATLLAKFGSLDQIYEALRTLGAAAAGIPLGVTQALVDFEPRLATTRQLVTMRTDAPVALEDILRERVAEPPAAPSGWEIEALSSAVEEESVASHAPEPEPISPPATAPPAPLPVSSPHAVPAREARLATREPDVLAAVPDDYERQLDPRDLKGARQLALDMHASRLFSEYGTPEAVLSTVMMGRELGLPAMASLRGIHIIEGRHSLSAGLMVALVLKSGLAEFFEPIAFSDVEATFETKRKGARAPVQLTYTFEMAQKAGLVKPKGNWDKNPMAMCIARAQAMLCRLIYPDLLAGLYTPEELDELREVAA